MPVIFLTRCFLAGKSLMQTNTMLTFATYVKGSKFHLVPLLPTLIMFIWTLL